MDYLFKETDNGILLSGKSIQQDDIRVYASICENCEVLNSCFSHNSCPQLEENDVAVIKFAFLRVDS